MISPNDFNASHNFSRSLRIPRKLHIIWVGHDNPKPERCIQSWRDNHPDWEFKLWTDSDIGRTSWITGHHLEEFVRRRKWPAVADLMRYEILYREGGVYADADSRSVRPLQDWLLESEMFASWENTLGRARLVNNAFLGSAPSIPFLRFVIDSIKERKQLFTRWSWSRMRYVRMGAWRSVGPHHLTKCIHSFGGAGYHGITILPSQMFSPHHYRDITEGSRSGVIFADHAWASTRKLYGKLSTQSGQNPEALRRSFVKT